jgi:hypothetical protein
VEAASVTLRFDAVSEDSRCPINAMCVTAGRAVVRLSVVAGGASAAVEIASDPATARAATAGSVRLEWQRLEPYPTAPPTTAPQDYRLTVRVAR